MSGIAGKKRKHLDFEVNLIPFIDLLSTCICFLLLTAVWMNVGALNVKQAVGGQAADGSAKKPTLWMQMASTGVINLDVRDSRVPAALTKLSLPAKDGKPDLAGLGDVLTKIKSVEPTLNTALIQPQAASVYEDIIALMDQVKKAGVTDLGVSPL